MLDTFLFYVGYSVLYKNICMSVHLRKERKKQILKLSTFTFFMLVHNIFVSSLSLRRLTSCGK